METAEVEMTKDTSKLAIWEALGKTDPSQTKQFKRAGGFTGTAIRPMWANKRMTEYFGPCGIAWGMDEPKFTLVEAAGEILVYCTVRMWYVNGEETGQVHGVGGDKVVSQVLLKDGKGQKIVDAEKGGYKTYPQTDDEAYKKAYTDALSNAMKMIGVGADVHMGQFEDSKYVQEVRQEFEEQKKAEVVAEVNRQKEQHKPQSYPTLDASEAHVIDPQATIPPELDWQYNRASGVLLCRIMKAEVKKTKAGKEYVLVSVNNELDKGKGVLLYYWHATHSQELLAAKGKVVKLMITAKEKGFTVDRVLEIDHKPLEQSQAVPPVAGIKPIGDPETQARLLASTLSTEESPMTEEDLMGLLKLSHGKWQDALEFLQREQARREVTA